ncbi:MAG: hypothetical protein JWR56_3109 [Massilia sp.]|nr:hypothetical protein [Massilia sp.]
MSPACDVLAPKSSLDESLRLAVEQMDIAHERSVRGHVTISVGIAILWQQGAADPDALMRPADGALYRAKDSGRNCVVLSDDPAVTILL